MLLSIVVKIGVAAALGYGLHRLVRPAATGTCMVWCSPWRSIAVAALAGSVWALVTTPPATATPLPTVAGSAPRKAPAAIYNAPAADLIDSLPYATSQSGPSQDATLAPAMLEPSAAHAPSTTPLPATEVKMPTIPTGQVVEADERLFVEAVNAQAKPILVDMYATWCGPCKKLAPELVKAAKQLGDDVYVLKIDVDKSPRVAGLLGVSGVPALFVIRGDEIVAKWAGYTNADVIVERVRQSLAPRPEN